MANGVLTISLDFELYWGIRDKKSIAEYQSNLAGVQQAVPEILRCFSESAVHATWATVGILFLSNEAELKSHMPKEEPSYLDKNLSAYEYVRAASKLDPLYHFAPGLIDKILETPGQEVGTHTFCHYYCLEPGQSAAQFREDMKMAIEVATAKGLPTKSIVFPRNQWNSEYLNVLSELGVTSYRGCESGWMYTASQGSEQSKAMRLMRVLDSYFSLSGPNTYSLDDCRRQQPHNFPSSRFLRPHSKRLASMDGLRLSRITSAMTHAAKKGEIYHLWWHPHNFGVNLKENIAFLSAILARYRQLRDQFGMTSLNMMELSELR